MQVVERMIKTDKYLRLFSTLLLLLVATTTVHAQEIPVPDTLDWRGYYPLEIGNVWQWTTHQPNVWFGGDADEFSHREIVSDTMINDLQYYVFEKISVIEFEVGAERNVYRSRGYLRYDTLQTRVVEYIPESNEELGTCNLNADFNAPANCYEGLDMWTGGGYASDVSFQLFVGEDNTPFNGVKEFGPGLTGGRIYYHGIGGLPTFGDGSSGTIAFSYVKVGVNEYGTRSVGVGIEEHSWPESSSLQLYPNPANSLISLTLPESVQGLEVRVVDILGQSASAMLTCGERRCELDVSSLSSGMYVLKYRRDAEVHGHKTFLVNK